MSVTIGSISAALLGKKSRQYCTCLKVQTNPSPLHEAKDECCPCLFSTRPFRYHMPLSLHLQCSCEQ